MSLCSLFAVSASVIFVEILSLRASTVAFGTDYQFFIIPLALFGMGLGGILVYAATTRLTAWSRLLPVSGAYPFFVLFPFFLVSTDVIAEFLALKILFFVLTFFVYAFAGAIIAFILARAERTAFAYAIDLFGAASGAFLAVILLNFIEYEKTLLALFAISAVPFVCLSLYARKRVWIPVVYGALVIIILLLPAEILLGRLALTCSSALPQYRASNAFAYLEVHDDPTHMVLSASQELGSLPLTLPFSNSIINLDCRNAVTSVINYDSLNEVNSLKESLRGIPFAFVARESGSAGSVLILGSGGGIDIIRALLFRATFIDAVEFNPLVIKATKIFSNPKTYPYSSIGVHLFIDDSRRFIETATTSYDLILSAKSSLYGAGTHYINAPSYSSTPEAYTSYLNHLNPGGVLALAGLELGSGLTQRAAESLRRKGLDPTERIIRIVGLNGRENLVLIRNEPFTNSDTAYIRMLTVQRGFKVYDGNVNTTTPRSSDDSPLFSGTHNLDPEVLQSLYKRALFEIIAFGFIVFALALVLPLAFTPELRQRSRVVLVAAHAAFFIAIGLGFVLIEIALIQKITFLLANPVYAVGLSLASILLFAGFGSLMVQRVQHRALIHVAVLGLLAPLLLFAFFADILIPHLFPFSLFMRGVFVVSALALPSFCMGVFFPSGLRQLGALGNWLIPWAWGISGLSAVIGGLMARTFSFQFGIRTTLLAGALAYAVAWICFVYARRRL